MYIYNYLSLSLSIYIYIYLYLYLSLSLYIYICIASIAEYRGVPRSLAEASAPREKLRGRSSTSKRGGGTAD